MEEDVDMLQNSLEDVELRNCASTEDPTTSEWGYRQLCHWWNRNLRLASVQLPAFCTLVLSYRASPWRPLSSARSGCGGTDIISSARRVFSVDFV
ncbi:hypothetical protein DPV78_001232 [Talaromyces pinophilus]|nr:hypothetical protein DPV78_001232 [Talaromyces pinophilus]